jgi:hypothetical protein
MSTSTITTKPGVRTSIIRGSQLRQERFTVTLQFLFQAFCAIARAAGPCFRAVLVPAITTRMRIFHTKQFKVFLPIRPFFFERWIAKTRLHPGRDAGVVHARLLHVLLIFIAGYGTLSERLLIDRAEERFLLARSNAGFDEIAHGEVMNLLRTK